VKRAHSQGGDLIVLPELASSGYVFETREEAYSLSEPGKDGPFVVALCHAAAELNVLIAAGYCERSGEKLFNSSILVGPQGVIGNYRKSHLWGAEALYFERGDLGFPVWTTRLGRIGMMICYDGWFPEAWRLCALQGADIVCVPTNWVPMPDQPNGQMAMANILCMAAAHSNSMFVAAACRTGVERGQSFIGQSVITAHTGWLAAGPASADGEEIIMAGCNLADARRKRTLNEFNQVMRDRRKDVYGEMLGASAIPNWY
jgi:N-carbamoylputrescine amidase